MRYFFAVLLVAVVGCSKEPSTSDVTREKVALAKSNLVRLLNDPESAQWRGLFWSEEGFLCGEVNAKNAFGGYGGFRRFYSNEFPEEALIEDEKSAVIVDTLWSLNCGGKVQDVK